MLKQYRFLSLFFLLASGLGLAAHPAHQHLHRDAHNLAGKASHLAGVLKTKTGFSHLTIDAMRLSNASKHFANIFHTRLDNDRHIVRDFAVITRHYNHLVQVFNRAHRVHHNPHVRHDFRAVQQAYAHLRGTVNNHLRHRGHRHAHHH